MKDHRTFLRNRRKKAQRKTAVPVAGDRRQLERRRSERRGNLLDLPTRLPQATGRPLIGWFCGLAPEEILYAAGFHPFRFFYDPTTISQSYGCLTSNLCPYVLNSLDSVLQAKRILPESYLITNSCDAMRRMYDAWRHFVGSSFVYMLDVPKRSDPSDISYYAYSLSSLVEFIEYKTNKKITEDELHQAIRLYNETRRLLARVYHLRKQSVSPFSGSEILMILKAAIINAKETVNQRLAMLLEQAGERVPFQSNSNSPRIMLLSSFFDDLSFLNIVEGNGGTVVCDQTCNGFGYFDALVDETGNPIEALAERYLTKTPCPRMMDSDRRLRDIMQSVKDYSVDGIIYYSLKFCDSNHFDFPHIRESLKQADIPVLFIETDGTSSNIGQINTKTKAFLATLKE